MKDVFICTYGDLCGAKVLLIDDVATSGATLNACAAVLKDMGAGEVNCLTIAKEI